MSDPHETPRDRAAPGSRLRDWIGAAVFVVGLSVLVGWCGYDRNEPQAAPPAVDAAR